MLPVIMTLEEDEAFIHWVARTMYYLGMSQPHLIYQYLNNGKDISTMGSLLFPTKLNQFSKKLFLPLLQDELRNRVLSEQTALNYYKPFIGSHLYSKLEQYILEHVDPSTIGKVASKTNDGLSQVKMCPKCQQSAIQKDESPTLSVTHQLPYVFFCHKCQNPLVQTSIPSKFYGLKLTTADRISIANAPIIKTRLPAYQEQLLIQFSSISYWLVKQGGNLGSLNQTRSKLWFWFGKKSGLDFQSSGSNVSAKSFAKHISNFFKDVNISQLKPIKARDTLIFLESSKKTESQMINPFSIALFCDFLSIGPKEFFTTGIINQLMGEPPWPCKNPVCDYFDQPKISVAKLNTSEDGYFWPTVTLCCDCGFKYGFFLQKNQGKKEKLPYDFVSSYGERWNHVLSSRWEDNAYSLDELSKLLKVQKAVVVYHAYLLGLKSNAKIGFSDTSWFSSENRIKFSKIERFKQFDTHLLDEQLAAEVHLAIKIFQSCEYTYSEFSKKNVLGFIDECTFGTFRTSRNAIFNNKKLDFPKTETILNQMTLEFVSTWMGQIDSFADRIFEQKGNTGSKINLPKKPSVEQQFKSLRYLASIQTGEISDEMVDLFDEVLLGLIQNNFEKVLEERDPFRQVTFNSIAGFIDRATIENNYPKSLSYIENSIEDNLTFWERKIGETKNYFESVGRLPTLGEFTKYSGKPTDLNTLKDQLETNIKLCVSDLRSKVFSIEDEIFLTRLKIETQRIKDHYPYVRVSYSEFCRRMNIEIQQFKNSLRNYPKSKSFVTESLESVDDFMVRKFLSSTKVFIDLGVTPNLERYRERCKFSSRKSAVWLKPILIETIESWPPDSIELLKSSITPVRSPNSEEV